MAEFNRDSIQDDPSSLLPGLRAAREQIEAARRREREMIASGRLTANRFESSPLSDQTLAGFTLIREIHRGGQGVVYEALQQTTNRKVAIKVLLDGAHASKSARLRFEREIELVAGLRHPNVISVFHSDQTFEGLRYCVMDYVCGQPLTRHVREAELNIEETLLLFAKVCDAVNHAHQKGVIHRDLKPSNILVDADGDPKVLDFGLAKIVGVESESLVSVAGQFVGTLPYMSPEQTRGHADEIDTRSDVYSLGILLYEMLTGKYPYPVIGPMADVLRHIAEAEPAPPSQHGWHGAISASRGRSETINDEIDTIVLKALAKDRERRYQSAGELGRDVRHYLAGEPIESKRDSAAYVIRKQLRRHRVAVGVGLGFLVLLVAGLATSLTFAFKAERALDAESNERARAQAISSFLTDLLTAADPDKAKGEALTLKEAMQAAEKRIEDGTLRDRPLVEAELRATIGSTYSSLGLPGNAAEQLRRADEIYSRERGASHPDTLKTRVRLTEALFWQTDYTAGTAVGEPNLAACRTQLGSDHPETLRAMVILGKLLPEVNRVAEGQAILEAAIEGRRRVFGENHVETADALKALGSTYIYHAEPTKSEPLFREAWRIHAAAFGEEDVRTVDTMLYVGSSLYNQYRAKESEEIFRRGLEIYRRKLGPEHYQTLGAQGDLGIALQRQGRYAEAEPLLREARDIHLRAFGLAKAATITAQRFLAGCVESQGRLEEAEQMYREALAAAIETYGPEHADTSVRLMASLSDLLARQKKDAEAEEIGLKVLDIQRRMTPRPDVAEFMQTCASLRAVYRRQGRKEEKLKIGREMVEMLASAASRPDASAGDLYRAGWILSTIEELELRDPIRGLDWARRASEQTNHENLRFEQALAEAYLRSGDVPQARQTWEHACTLVDDDASRARVLNGAAWSLLSARPESIRDPREALPLARRANDLTEYKEPNYLDTLALACFRTGDTHGAIEFQTKALELLPSDSADRDDFAKRLSSYQASENKKD